MGVGCALGKGAGCALREGTAVGAPVTEGFGEGKDVVGGNVGKSVGTVLTVGRSVGVNVEEGCGVGSRVGSRLGADAFCGEEYAPTCTHSLAVELRASMA